MDAVDIARADAWAPGITTDHPLSFLRAGLNEQGVVRVADVPSHRNGARITVAGQVTHRQAPQTAGGVIFLSLEDETGILNIICSTGVGSGYKRAFTDDLEQYMSNQRGKLSNAGRPARPYQTTPRPNESTSRVLNTSAALVVRGKLERADGAISLVAEVIYPLWIPFASKSRDFR